ncbi:hypothetical protein [Caldimonas tepidiphila]|uniref:hypothetical protein n=1 Tax=Caldimonas tepidiphila TaxID=2315841 RepID=UPI000E5A5696|nr:hypothetical protein [Caldimonas tepidiphila]
MTTTAETRLAAYLAAEVAILQAQEVSVDGRRHRMAELADVQRQIRELQQQVNLERAAVAGRSRLGFSLANLRDGRA